MTKTRTEAFSDGVFAIAITLLVLNIKLPAEEANSNTELFHLLHSALPKILTFIFSFLVVGVFWVAHHRIYEYINNVNHYILWSNIIYLMSIAIIPFPAAVLAQHPVLITSVFFYSSILFLCAVQHFFLIRYVYKHEEIKTKSLNAVTYKNAMRTALVGPICYLLAIVFSFVTPIISFIILIMALVFYIFLSPVLLKPNSDM